MIILTYVYGLSGKTYTIEYDELTTYNSIMIRLYNIHNINFELFNVLLLHDNTLITEINQLNEDVIYNVLIKNSIIDIFYGNERSEVIHIRSNRTIGQLKELIYRTMGYIIKIDIMINHEIDVNYTDETIISDFITDINNWFYVIIHGIEYNINDRIPYINNSDTETNNDEYMYIY